MEGRHSHTEFSKVHKSIPCKKRAGKRSCATQKNEEVHAERRFVERLGGQRIGWQTVLVKDSAAGPSSKKGVSSSRG